MKPKPTPAYPVSDPRHTLSSARLSDLSWDNWFTDGGLRQLYLHVQHSNGETWHRVFCRHADRPRLEARKGKLYWLVDKPRNPKRADFTGWLTNRESKTYDESATP